MTRTFRPIVSLSIFCILLITFIFTVFLSFCPEFTRPAIAYNQGNQFILVNSVGEGLTESDALTEAWLNAVRQVVGMMISAETNIHNDEIDQDITSYSHGVVAKYELLEKHKTRLGYKVRIKAFVTRETLADNIAKLHGDAHKCDGKSVLANAITADNKNQTASKMLDILFNRYPSKNFASVEMVRGLAYDENNQKFNCVVRVLFNDHIYSNFITELKNNLRQIASYSKSGMLPTSFREKIQSAQYSHKRSSALYSNFTYRTYLDEKNLKDQLLCVSFPSGRYNHEDYILRKTDSMEQTLKTYCTSIQSPSLVLHFLDSQGRQVDVKRCKTGIKPLSVYMKNNDCLYIFPYLTGDENRIEASSFQCHKELLFGLQFQMDRSLLAKISSIQPELIY